MEQRPESEQPSYGGYKGPSSSEPAYSADEMPQSSYPHDGPTPSPQDPYGSSSYQQPPYGQQQQSAYGQQQQQYQYQQPGYQQPDSQAGDVGPMERTSTGLRARTAGFLSYLLTWITGIIFILIERENRFVRFHAMQSIILFGSLSILQWVIGSLPFLHALGVGLGIVQFVCWIFLMIQAWKGRYYKLPVIGDYAERFANQIKV